MRIRWRGFELPARCVPVEKEKTKNYGKFIIEPFERGFGHTIGNGFRRILLSSIEGSAIVSVKFHGVSHEFSTIPGVYEDIQEIILNIKELNFRITGEATTGEISIDKSGKGEVRGSDLKCPPEIEMVNPNHVIATVTDQKSAFKADMILEKNRGYMSAEENSIRLKAKEKSAGFIAIDATFSPILRVRYSVEDTRVGNITNYDRLILEVWTNGIIKPEEALIECASIYKKHLNCFTRLREMGEELEEKRKPGLLDEKVKRAKEELKKKFETPVTELGLSVRTINCLTTKGLSAVGDIISKAESEITKIRNFGKTSARELKTKLAELGLTFQMDIDEEIKKLEEMGVE